MKIAIYSPYLDTAGGGEKYMLGIAEVLSTNHQVDVLIDDHLNSLGIDQIKRKIIKFHNLKLINVNFVKSPIGPGGSFLKRLLFLKKYDYLFLNTDGSIFFSTAKKSILHFQIPVANKLGNSSWAKLKLKSWNLAIYNSKFTKDFIEQQWQIKGEIVYPPVNIENFKNDIKKKKQIISVGRFAAYTKVKKHEVLIDTFIKMSEKNDVKGWSLHLAGGAGDGDQEYLKELKKRIGKNSIYLYPNITIAKLVDLYGESAIYWHAMGYKEEDPLKFEHFGITTVEAMASGAVPVVINKGGQKEIVDNKISGFLWNSVEDCIEKTQLLISDSTLRTKMSFESIKAAKKYSFENFAQKINKLVNEN